MKKKYILCTLWPKLKHANHSSFSWKYYDCNVVTWVLFVKHNVPLKYSNSKLRFHIVMLCGKRFIYVCIFAFPPKRFLVEHPKISGTASFKGSLTEPNLYVSLLGNDIFVVPSVKLASVYLYFYFYLCIGSSQRNWSLYVLKAYNLYKECSVMVIFL